MTPFEVRVKIFPIAVKALDMQTSQLAEGDIAMDEGFRVTEVSELERLNPKILDEPGLIRHE